MRTRGRIGLTELVLWDVVLAGLAAGLIYVDTRWEHQQTQPVQTVKKKKKRKQTARRKTAEASSPKVGQGTRRATQSDDARELEASPGERELKALRAKAREHLPKHPDLALALYEKAPASLRGSVAWQAFWPGERKRLLGALRKSDLLRCLRPEIEHAADMGRPKRVKRLLTLLPTSAQAALDLEVGRAQETRAQQKKKKDPLRDPRCAGQPRGTKEDVYGRHHETTRRQVGEDIVNRERHPTHYILRSVV